MLRGSVFLFFKEDQGTRMCILTYLWAEYLLVITYMYYPKGVLEA